MFRIITIATVLLASSAAHAVCPDWCVDAADAYCGAGNWTHAEVNNTGGVTVTCGLVAPPTDDGDVADLVLFDLPKGDGADDDGACEVEGFCADKDWGCIPCAYLTSDVAIEAEPIRRR